MWLAWHMSLIKLVTSIHTKIVNIHATIKNACTYLQWKLKISINFGPSIWAQQPKKQFSRKCKP